MPRLRLQSVANEKLKFRKPNKAFSTTAKYRNCDRPALTLRKEVLSAPLPRAKKKIK